MWTVKAYKMNSKREFELYEWGSGFSYKQARSYYWSLHSLKELGKITMTLGSEKNSCT
jgi:hypothetical protein